MAKPLLVCVSDYQLYAEETLPRPILQYFNSGANYEQTYRDNVLAFQRYRFRPRYMQNVSTRNLSTSLLGDDVKCPIGVSPMSMCRLAHPDGEIALAKACEAIGACMTLSMTATTSVEEIGSQVPGCLRWFQVHVLRDREMTYRMVQRAEQAGFKALVLTVDCAVHGKRYKDLRNQFALPPHFKLANFEEELKRIQSSIKMEESRLEWGQFVNQAFSPSHTWQDLTWLKRVTSLPIIAKGVLTGADAEAAIQHGANAVWVSNHGGRELDCLPASIDALGEVSQAVNGRAEVYLDGGVRSGLDVLKALARGAHAVFCGRPALWGLVHNGTEGAKHVLGILQDELSVGMALAGVTDVKNIPHDLVVHKTFYTSKL